MNRILFLQFFYLAVILFSAIMAYVFRKSLKSRRLGILIPYLFYVFAQELCLVLLDYYHIIPSNNVVYNLYRPLSVLILGSIYYFIPFMVPLQKIMLWIAGLYFLANIIIYAFVDSIFQINGYLILIRGFTITSFCIFFLFRYFNLDNSKVEEFWRPVIWVTIGIIIFYPVSSISIVFKKYLSDYNAEVAGFKLYQVIPQILSLFMYSCFGYAFYLCKKKEQSWM